MRAALRLPGRARAWTWCITSGGLGPTADDLTAEVVAEFQGRAAGARRGARGADRADPRAAARRAGRDLDPDALRAGNRKQALVPEGATVLEPVGTAPGLVVPPRGRRRPDGRRAARARRASCSRCGAAARGGPGLPRRASPARPTYAQRMLRLFGIPESEIAETLRVAAARASTSTRWRSRPACGAARSRSSRATSRRAEPVYDALRGRRARAPRRHAVLRRRLDRRRAGRARCCSTAGWTIATAESCTGGLLAGRLTERAGSSAYVLGGVVVYANEAKVALAGVDRGADRAPRRGVAARSPRRSPTARARALGADVGVGITGIAGPGGGHAGEAGRAPSASRCARGAGDAPDAPRCTCRAAARTSATARRRSRCTCSGGCCCGRGAAPARLRPARAGAERRPPPA